MRNSSRLRRAAATALLLIAAAVTLSAQPAAAAEPWGLTGLSGDPWDVSSDSPWE